MKYKFDVKLTMDDYIAYNNYILIRSPYGKGSILKTRIMFVVIGLIAYIITSFEDGVLRINTLTLAICAVIWGILLLLYPKLLCAGTKTYIRSMTKKGKPAFSPESVVEFYEDHLVESTDDNRTEVKYSAFERVSIVDGKYIFFHMNNVMSYIVPMSCFESVEHYDEFMRFVGENFSNIETY